jgi:hypothetical protein
MFILEFNKVVLDENIKNQSEIRAIGSKNKEEEDSLDMIIFPRLSQGLSYISTDYCTLM